MLHQNHKPISVEGKNSHFRKGLNFSEVMNNFKGTKWAHTCALHHISDGGQAGKLASLRVSAHKFKHGPNNVYLQGYEKG